MSTANKLTYLNVTKQKLKQAINNIGGEVTDETTFREYVNQLQNVYDNLPKTEYQEGTEINLGVTIKGKLDYDNGVVGIGQCEQNGTPTPSTPIDIQCVTGNQDVVVSGKNLYNDNAETEAYYYNASGEKVASPSASETYINLEYNLSDTAITISRATMVGGPNIRICEYNGTAFIKRTLTTAVSETITLDSNTTRVIFSINKSETAYFTNLMIETGSTATTYEPYKTPKTYQFSLGDHKFYGIGTYRDYILRTTGKNLFDIADCRNNYTLGSDGIPTYNASQTRIANMTPIIVEGMEKVTMTFTNYHNGAFMYSLLKADNTLITRTINCSSGTTITIGEAKYMYICFYDNATTENVKDAMLVEGSTALDYQPFGVGNWYKVGKIGEVIFDGSSDENWEFDSGNVSPFTHQFTKSKNYSPALSNYFINSENVIGADNKFGFNSNGSTIWFKYTSLFATLEAFTTWLSTHNIKVIYELATPTYTPITGTLAEQLEEWYNAHSNNGTTIITSNGDLPMIIKVRGLKGE